MLRQLTINNIAVIENAQIEFLSGFNVLTGETGAGKSIIIDSLNMLKGERASKAIIRSGETKAKVSGIVDVTDEVSDIIKEETGIDAPDGEIMISREITLDGKNNIRINGEMVTLAVLKKLGDIIINIHGQHDNTSLLSKKVHVKFLDRFGFGEIQPMLDEYKRIHQEYMDIQEKLNSLSDSEQDKARRVDMLKFQIDEISSCDLHVGEEEELSERKNVLENSQLISESVQEAYSSIYDNDYGQSAYDTLWNGINRIEKAASIDSSLEKIHSSLSDAGYMIEDSLRELKRYIDNLSYDQSEMDEIEERLDVIYGLKRKYGNSIEEILSYYEKINLELDTIENSNELIEKLKIQLEKLEKERINAAALLTDARRKWGEKLSKLIMAELSDLDMSKVKFSVSITPCDFRENGADDIEFLICTNVGEDFKPLTKIASGGELSRVILSDCESADTLIFDEVDTGVSGHAAQSLGVKLYDMSRKAQVLCITHLPQIAAMADNHYLIKKNVENDRTVTKVTLMDNDERIDELSRTLGGASITDITRQNAKELLSQAKEYKTKGE